MHDTVESYALTIQWGSKKLQYLDNCMGEFVKSTDNGYNNTSVKVVIHNKLNFPPKKPNLSIFLGYLRAGNFLKVFQLRFLTKFWGFVSKASGNTVSIQQ